MKISKKILIAVISLILAGVVFADTTYKVEKGDTLYSISRKFQITVAELRAANNLTETDVLKAGQKLTIPSDDIATAAALNSKTESTASSSVVKTETYVVQKGDTLYSLAKKNNMKVDELLSLNGLDSNAVIKVGQKLKIKAASSSTAETKTPVATSDAKKATTTKTDTAKTDTPAIVPDTRTYDEKHTVASNVSWPVKASKVTYRTGKISGVTLTCKENEDVKSVREGTVMYVGLYRGYGQVVFIQSKTGLIYAYTGLGDVKVNKFDYVVSGDVIGTAGIDSISKTPQITFMVFQGSTPIDPAKAPRG